MSESHSASSETGFIITRMSQMDTIHLFLYS
jgi:hypothetical protein